MRRCGQLGIPYAETIGSPYFALQGLVAPELFVQYTEGVDGYTGPPERRRPLDSLKTLPHDLLAVRALLLCDPGRPLEQGSNQHRPNIDNVDIVGERSSSASNEPIAMPAVSPSSIDGQESTPSDDLEFDLSDIFAEENDAQVFVAAASPPARTQDSYMPPELPRERWQVVNRAGYEDSIEWFWSETEIGIDGDGWLPPRPKKAKKRNNDFKERGKNGRKSKRRARSIRGSWVSLDPVVCRAWCDALIERCHFSKRDIDEVLAECAGDTSVEDLRVHIMRALEGFGFAEKNESDVAASLWDQPTDVDPDELFTAVDAALNRSVTLPGTERLTMERASDEAELQALLAARQDLALEVLSHDSALQTAINLRLSGNRDGFSEMQKLSAWTDSGRPNHGKTWRAAVNAVEMLWLSEAEYRQVVSESGLRHQHEGDNRHLIRAFDQYTLLLTKTRTRYLPYVRRLVSRSLARQEEMEDAFQSATLGLFRALDLLNGKSASAFRYYLSQWVNAKFLQWRGNHDGLIRIPQNRLQDIRDFERARLTLKTSPSRPSERQALASQLGWDLERVAEFECLLRTSVPLTDVADDGEWGANPVADYMNKELSEVIDAAIERYDVRDAMVIRLYFGLDHAGDHTLEVIGSMLGVTRERIRQLRERMLERLRAFAKKTELHYFAEFEGEP